MTLAKFVVKTRQISLPGLLEGLGVFVCKGVSLVEERQEVCLRDTKGVIENMRGVGDVSG